MLAAGRSGAGLLRGEIGIGGGEGARGGASRLARAGEEEEVEERRRGGCMGA